MIFFFRSGKINKQIGMIIFDLEKRVSKHRQLLHNIGIQWGMICHRRQYRGFLARMRRS